MKAPSVSYLPSLVPSLTYIPHTQETRTHKNTHTMAHTTRMQINTKKLFKIISMASILSVLRTRHSLYLSWLFFFWQLCVDSLLGNCIGNSKTESYIWTELFAGFRSVILCHLLCFESIRGQLVFQNLADVLSARFKNASLAITLLNSHFVPNFKQF